MRLILRLSLGERVMSALLIGLAPFYRAALVAAMAWTLVMLAIVARGAWNEWRSGGAGGKP